MSEDYNYEWMAPVQPKTDEELRSEMGKAFTHPPKPDGEAEMSRIEQAIRKFGETGVLHLPDDRPVREQVLDEAKQAVCSDRNAEYGEPIDNFSRWAGMCNAAGYRGPGGRDLKPHDLAIIMGLGKFSRAMETPKKRDHGVDVAGYGSLMTELALTED